MGVCLCVKVSVGACGGGNPKFQASFLGFNEVGLWFQLPLVSKQRKIFFLSVTVLVEAEEKTISSDFCYQHTLKAFLLIGSHYPQSGLSSCPK